MALKKFVSISISASHNEELPIELYEFDDTREMTQHEIEELVDENAAEILLESDWAAWDIDVRFIEREVPDDEG